MNKHIIPVFIIILFISSSFIGASNTSVEVIDELEEVESTLSNNLSDSPWPMLCHDTHHTGRSPYRTEHITGEEKWRFICDGMDGGIIVDEEGIIYFGEIGRYVYSIYPNGTLRWSFKTEGGVTSTPALTEDGILYVSSWDGGLYALNSTNGNKIWRCQIGDSASSPLISDDGIIYCASFNYDIVAVSPNGTKVWKYTTDYKITSDPVIGDDGTVYCGSTDTYFYALNPNGTLKWRFKTGNYIKGPASIAEDGTVYIGSWDDYLYALNPVNGSMKWKIKVGAGTETNPSIAEDGTIYVGGDKLWAINPNGTMKWEFDLGLDRHIHKSCPAISSDGTLYVGTNIGQTAGGEIIAVNPDGTERWRKWICNDWCDSSPSISKDGTVYIGTVTTSLKGEGQVIAFGPKMISKPKSGLYIMNLRFRRYYYPDRLPIIIGPVTVKIDTSAVNIDIDRVEFYIDGKLKSNDTDTPYKWRWGYGGLFKHRHDIKVIAFDSEGNSVSDETKVWKFL